MQGTWLIGEWFKEVFTDCGRKFIRFRWSFYDFC